MVGRPLQASDRAVLAGLARLLPRQAPKGRPPGPPHPRVPDSRLTWMEEVLGNHRQSRQPSLYAGVYPETGAGRKARARLPVQAGPAVRWRGRHRSDPIRPWAADQDRDSWWMTLARSGLMGVDTPVLRRWALYFQCAGFFPDATLSPILLAIQCT